MDSTPKTYRVFAEEMAFVEDCMRVRGIAQQSEYVRFLLWNDATLHASPELLEAAKRVRPAPKQSQLVYAPRIRNWEVLRELLKQYARAAMVSGDALPDWAKSLVNGKSSVSTVAPDESLVNFVMRKCQKPKSREQLCKDAKNSEQIEATIAYLIANNCLVSLGTNLITASELCMALGYWLHAQSATENCAATPDEVVELWPFTNEEEAVEDVCDALAKLSGRGSCIDVAWLLQRDRIDVLSALEMAQDKGRVICRLDSTDTMAKTWTLQNHIEPTSPKPWYVHTGFGRVIVDEKFRGKEFGVLEHDKLGDILQILADKGKLTIEEISGAIDAKLDFVTWIVHVAERAEQFPLIERDGQTVAIASYGRRWLKGIMGKKSHPNEDLEFAISDFLDGTDGASIPAIASEIGSAEQDIEACVVRMWRGGLLDEEGGNFYIAGRSSSSKMSSAEDIASSSSDSTTAKKSRSKTAAEDIAASSSSSSSDSTAAKKSRSKTAAEDIAASSSSSSSDSTAAKKSRSKTATEDIAVSAIDNERLVRRCITRGAAKNVAHFVRYDSRNNQIWQTLCDKSLRPSGICRPNAVTCVLCEEQLTTAHVLIESDLPRIESCNRFWDGIHDLAHTRAHDNANRDANRVALCGVVLTDGTQQTKKWADAPHYVRDCKSCARIRSHIERIPQHIE